MSIGLYFHIDRSLLEFNAYLRIEISIEVRQHMTRVTVVSRRHKNSRKWHGAMSGDLDRQIG